MDQKIKRKWVKALLSGKYKQGAGELLDVNGAYCCLGVLARQLGVTPDDMRGRSDLTELRWKKNVLPRVVQNELTKVNDLVYWELDGVQIDCGPVPFDMIAGLIDEAL